jgi:NodT family efflux transporter outer membrane factor (OMF) lipoprotein
VPPQGAAPLPDLPAAWASAEPGGVGHATPLASWWNRFDDPLLGQLVKQALQANTSVLGAQAALRQARALRDVAAAALVPGLNTSGSAQRSRSGGASSNNFQAGLDASWELDVFGVRRQAVAAADATVLAGAASLGDVQVSIAGELGLAYVALRSAQARLAIATDNLTSQLETLQITGWRWQAGLVSALEAEQARAAAEQTRAQLPALQSGIGQFSHAIAVLSGRPPSDLDALLAPARPLPQPQAGLALLFPADTLRQRADVRAAQARVSAAIAGVAQAEAARLPSFRLAGSLGLSAASLGALTRGASVMGSLLAGVAWPLLDGGAARAQVRVQQAAADQAWTAYKAVLLLSLQEVEDSLLALRGDGERVSRLQDAALAAGAAAQMARQRYDSGLIDFQVVLETQRTRLATQDSLASAQADHLSDHLRLYKAVGGGWNPDRPEAAAAPPSPLASGPTP